MRSTIERISKTRLLCTQIPINWFLPLQCNGSKRKILKSPIKQNLKNKGKWLHNTTGKKHFSNSINWRSSKSTSQIRPPLFYQNNGFIELLKVFLNWIHIEESIKMWWLVSMPANTMNASQTIIFKCETAFLLHTTK